MNKESESECPSEECLSWPLRGSEAGTLLILPGLGLFVRSDLKCEVHFWS